MYVDTEGEYGFFPLSFGLSILIYFLMNRCYEKGGHWLIAPIIYTTGLGFIGYVLNSGISMPEQGSPLYFFFIVEAFLSLGLIVAFLYVYIRFLSQKNVHRGG